MKSPTKNPLFSIRATKFAQSGFSLIEMMIALTIGLMLIAALTAVVMSGSRSNSSNDKTAELQNNGRYALDVIKRDLQHAGHHGLTGADVSAGAVTVNNDCASGFAANLSQYIYGLNNSNPYSATCIPDYVANTDIVVVRYLSLSAAPSTPGVGPTIALPWTDQTVFFRSAYGVGGMFQGASAPGFSNSPQEDHTVETHVYYISPFTVSATENPLIPALWRVVLTPDGAMTRELVASGIEQLQLQYGVLSTTGNIQYLNANDVDTSTSGTTPATPPPNQKPWDRVRSVRIWLSSRNSTPEAGGAYINPGFAMGDLTPAAVVLGTESYRRQLFTSTIQLRN